MLWFLYVWWFERHQSDCKSNGCIYARDLISRVYVVAWGLEHDLFNQEALFRA